MHTFFYLDTSSVPVFLIDTQWAEIPKISWNLRSSGEKPKIEWIEDTYQVRQVILNKEMEQLLHVTVCSVEGIMHVPGD